MKRGVLGAVVSAVVTALVAAACTGPGATTTTTGPAGPREVTLITHDSFDVSKGVLRAFEGSSGIDVTVVPAGDAGQVVNRAILTAGDPEADVLFGVDDNLLADALAAGVFLPYASPRLDAVPDTYELDPEHRVTPIDRGDVCVNIDLARFDYFVPESFEDLASPAVDGGLVVENPATSSPGLAFLLATIAEYGDPGFEDYWADLRANGVRVVDGWEQAYFGEFSGAGGGEGERPLVVSYATSPVAEIVFAEEPPATAPTGVIEATCYRQIEFAGILAGTDHETEARALVDFMLSREFQQDIPLRMFVFPVVDDAVLPQVFVDNAVVPAAPLALDPAAVAANREDWVQRWTDVVLR